MLNKLIFSSNIPTATIIALPSPSRVAPAWRGGVGGGGGGGGGGRPPPPPPPAPPRKKFKREHPVHDGGANDDHPRCYCFGWQRSQGHIFSTHQTLMDIDIMSTLSLKKASLIANMYNLGNSSHFLHALYMDIFALGSTPQSSPHAKFKRLAQVPWSRKSSWPRACAACEMHT
jgi:hypothetical protein